MNTLLTTKAVKPCQCWLSCSVCGDSDRIRNKYRGKKSVNVRWISSWIDTALKIWLTVCSRQIFVYKSGWTIVLRKICHCTESPRLEKMLLRYSRCKMLYFVFFAKLSKSEIMDENLLGTFLRVALEWKLVDYFVVWSLGLTVMC